MNETQMEKSPPPIWEQVRVALRDGQDSAIKKARNAVKNQKLPEEIASAIEAQLLWDMGEPTRAREVLEAAKKNRPLGPHEKVIAAYFLFDEGKFDEGEKLLVEAKKAGVCDPRIDAGLGQAESVKNNVRMAMKHLEEALRQDPKLWNARYLLGCAFVVTKEHAKAEAAFEQVTRERRDFEPAWRDLAAVRLAQGRASEAAAALESIAREHPDWYLIQIALADCHEIAGANERAVEVLAPLAKKDTNPALIVHYAELCMMIGRVDAAKAAIAKLSWSGELPAAAQLLKGRIAAHEGDLPGALASYKKALACDPENARIKNALGHLLLLDTPVKNWTEAGEVLESAVKGRDPPPLEPLLNLAILRAQEGKTDVATKLATQVLAQKPHDPSIVEQAKRLVGLDADKT